MWASGVKMRPLARVILACGDLGTSRAVKSVLRVNMPFCHVVRSRGVCPRWIPEQSSRMTPPLGGGEVVVFIRDFSTARRSARNDTGQGVSMFNFA